MMLVLGDAASWAVTPESFAHPLAEANVVVVMVSFAAPSPSGTLLPKPCAMRVMRSLPP